jgi:hypothetical protein
MDGTTVVLVFIALILLGRWAYDDGWVGHLRNFFEKFRTKPKLDTERARAFLAAPPGTRWEDIPPSEGFEDVETG